MNKLALLVPLVGLALAACVAYNVDDRDGTDRVRLGETVAMSGFRLTPLEVVEDSRCPTGVQCVWAGRLRLRARIDFDDSTAERELTLGEAQPVGTGMLKLVEAQPHPQEGQTTYPEDYRFGFTYAPNIAK
jgi:hypothetical protein